MASWSRAEDEQPAPGPKTRGPRWEWIVTFNTQELGDYSPTPAWTRIRIEERAGAYVWVDYGKVWPAPSEADEIS